MVIFEDWNNPGLYYRGTEEHMQGLFRQGGYPSPINPALVQGDKIQRIENGKPVLYSIKDAPDHWLCQSCG